MKIRTEKDFVIEQLYDQLDIEMESILHNIKIYESDNEDNTDIENMISNTKIIQICFSIYSALMKADFTLECATALLEKEKDEHNLIDKLKKSLIKRIDSINIYNEKQMVTFVELSVSMID